MTRLLGERAGGGEACLLGDLDYLGVLVVDLVLLWHLRGGKGRIYHGVATRAGQFVFRSCTKPV